MQTNKIKENEGIEQLLMEEHEEEDNEIELTDIEKAQYPTR